MSNTKVKPEPIDAETEALFNRLSDRVADLGIEYDITLPPAVKVAYRDAMSAALRILDGISYGSVPTG